MPRAKRGNKRTEKRKKILALAKGYRGTKSKLYRSAKESVERGLNFAYTGRKLKKRDFRKLWIVRINAACRLNDIKYSQFMHGLDLAGIELDAREGQTVHELRILHVVQAARRIDTDDPKLAKITFFQLSAGICEIHCTLYRLFSRTVQLRFCSTIAFS